MVKIPQVNPMSVLSSNLLFANFQLFALLWALSLALGQAVKAPNYDYMYPQAHSVTQRGDPEKPIAPEPKLAFITREYRH